MSAPNTDDDIAIVGISCRFPGGIQSAADLWNFVATDQHVSSDFPPDRPMPEMIGIASPDAIASFAPKGGFIDEPGAFDAEFFGISPREAKAMDPQQRVSLELCWQALEDAAIDPHRLRASRTGVYVGAMTGDYAYLAVGRQDLDPGYIATGASQSVLSGRISYLFGFQGPSMTIDTACSSSLVAMHIAANALRAGECSLALAGGVTIMSTLTSFYALGQHGAVSRDGRSKAYSSNADGFCVSEGGAVLVLERMSDAQRNGHRILALLRGSAVNQDGASNGLTAPSAPAQMNLIRDALDSGALTVSDVDVLEGHGTGTPVGDPLELEALFATYGQRGPDDGPLLLGSIKSNFGHAQAAAGTAGVIKMVEAMRRGVVPATLHVAEPTSSVDWSAGAVEVVTETRDWPERGRPRRSAVSSFGISGTNAHVILEQAPENTAEDGDAPRTLVTDDVILTVSGRSEAARTEQAARLAAHLRAHPEQDQRTVARALGTSRSSFEYRAAVVGSDRASLESDLASIGDGHLLGTIHGVAMDHKVVFVFPGQGGQYPAMGARLMRESTVFADHIRACDDVLSRYIDWSVTDMLLGGDNTADVRRADVIQPLLFATMTGIAKVWKSIGVQPDAVLGHSQGELAAAYTAGILSLEDAARITALRSVAVTKLAGTGAMASINASADRIDELAADLDDIGVAAVNSSRTTVMSGATASIAQLCERCERDGIRFRTIDVDYAGHSSHIDVLREDVKDIAASVDPQFSDTVIFSTVVGDAVAPGKLGPEYWFRNLRDVVRFRDAVEAAYAAGYTAFLEMRLQPVLTAAMYETFEEQGADSDFVFAVGSATREDDGVHGFLTSVASAYVRGVAPDWDALFADAPSEAVELPGYPFQRENFWLAGGGAVRGGQPSAFGLTDPEHPLLGAITAVPGADRYHFSARLSLSDYPWLADHALNGTVLVPGAMLLELALQAGHKVGSPRVDKLTMHTPIALPTTGAVQLQLLVGEPKRGRRPVSIYSRPEPEKSSTSEPLYTLHADGVLTTPAGDSGDAPGMEFWPPTGAKMALDTTEAYTMLAALGYQYGPVFQGMRNVWRRGDEVYAEVALPDSIRDADKYGLHPALLDAAMQTIVAAAESTGLTGLALPYRWENVSLFAVGASALRVRISPAGKDRVSWLLSDSSGRTVGTGVLQLRTVAVDKLAERGLSEKKNSLFQVDWMRVTVPAGRRPKAAEWAVVTDRHADTAAGEVIAERHGLQSHQDITALASAIDLGHPSPAVIVWSAIEASTSVDVRDRLVCTLQQLQQWLASEHFANSRLVILTRGVHSLDNSGGLTDLAGAAVWGLVRSVQSENPDRIVQIDLDNADITFDTIATAIAAEEPELLLRRGDFYGRRIRAELDNAIQVGERLRSGWSLNLPQTGNLEDASIVAEERIADASLPPGTVSVELRAAGISFPVVLAELGRPAGVPSVRHGGAGVVRAVADGVTAFEVGDRVFGLVDDIGDTAVADERVLAVMPPAWSFAEAATAPVAYLTAAHAMDIAEPQRGQSILIHCATSGVGTAAVNLARRAGLDVFATASRDKWPTLRDRGFDAERVGDSRSAAFGQQLLSAHGGADIVFNMVTEDLTAAALEVVKPGGRFIEIGRATVLDDQTAEVCRPDITYRTFELTDIAPDRVRTMLSELAAAFAGGELAALPVTCFDVRQAGTALRHAGESHRVGTVALTWPAPFDPAKTVLVTGGTGAIGRVVAGHLAQRYGARHLLLTSRTGPAAEGMEEFVADMAAGGVDVEVAACDVADRSALEGLLSRIPTDRPLGAVIHLAATLADATLPSLTAEHIDAVLPAKAVGAQNLHDATSRHNLSMFVMFSSAAGTFGAPGQANYAAANTFVDALAQHRYSRGLPATSMAWGWWAEVSANTSTLDETDRARLTRIGIVPMPSAAALDMFDAAVATGLPYLVPIGMNLGLLRAAAAVTELPPLFRALLHIRPRATQQMGDSGELAKRLVGLDAEQQHSTIIDLLTVPIAMVLGYSSPSDVTPDREFHDMGIDSLSSIELGTHLRAITGLKLSNSVIFEYPTVSLLARHVLNQLAPDDADRSDPILAELEMLLEKLSDIHTESPVPVEVVDRLSASLGRLRVDTADGTGDRQSVSLDA
ncbi:type I polyketide synthase [Mycobacterium sp. CPCC 205372]|uniref:Type I polyketide synthase n=1 Tax=Mycobacterium hippophais TaxID=3016340 RepID=A0ABT4PS33_9MYCO|nr:type I polyketide synthase [Mycobacterium hippophais]MCZ8379358.1 type I polyketide synthase [Mycobacterium hippophais]